VESVVVGVVGGLHKARAAAPRYVVVASLGTRDQVLCRVKAMTLGLGELDAYGGNSSIAFADITATGRLVGRFANCTTSRQIEWFLRQMRLNGGIPPSVNVEIPTDKVIRGGAIGDSTDQPQLIAQDED
jgi:hypothetical protein